jgi:MFS family permease
MTAQTTADDAACGPPAATRSPLRQPAIAALLLSEVVSSTGSQMSMLAVPWFVLITTGSITKMGFVFAAELLPVALLGIPAGLLVARIGVRRTMLAGDGLRAPLIALIPLLHMLGVLSFPILLLIVMVLGAVSTPYVAAQRLALPEVVGEDEQLVLRASGLLEAAVRLASLLGPALAGGIIALIGATNVLWVDAATFAFSFAVLLPLLKPRMDLAAAAVSGGLLIGAKAVMRDPLLATVAGASVLYGVFFPFVIASLPVLAEIRFNHNPHVAGALLAAWGGGALIGAVAISKLAGRLGPLWMGAGAALAIDAAVWFLPWHLPVVALAAALALAGVFTPLLNAPMITLLMTRTAPQSRAQAVTFVVATNLLAGPAAYALSGVLFSKWGTEPVLVAVAVGLLACALILVRLAAKGTGTVSEGTVTDGTAALEAIDLPEPEVIAHIAMDATDAAAERHADDQAAQ